jgi:hypothetical protein
MIARFHFFCPSCKQKIERWESRPVTELGSAANSTQQSGSVRAHNFLDEVGNAVGPN